MAEDKQKILDDLIARDGVDAVVAKLTKQPKIKNPFKGKNFNLTEAGALYADPKTRAKAIEMAAKAGIALNPNPGEQDLKARRY